MKLLLPFLGVIALAVGVSLLLTFPVMWIINHTFASSFLTFVFGTPQITFWPTFGLSVLFGLGRTSSTSSSK